MTTKQAYLGRFSLATPSLRFTVNQTGAEALTLTAADYFMRGYTSEGVGLCEHIQATIRAIGAGYTTVTCTLDMTTGKITIANFDANTSFTWTDTLLRDRLGWEGDLSGATTYTAPNRARFTWFPGLAPSKIPTQINEFWEWRSNTTINSGPDGGGHGASGGEQFAADIRYDLLLLADVQVAQGAGQSSNRSFERFLRDVAGKAQPIRIVPDRTVYAAVADFKVGLFGPPGKPIGGWRDWATSSFGEEDHALWDVSLFFQKYDGV